MDRRPDGDAATFFLLRDSDSPRLEARHVALLAALARQGIRSPRCFAAAGCNICLYDKLLAAHENAYREDEDNFCLSVGTFLYRGEIGAAALQRFHADFRPTIASDPSPANSA